MKEFKVNKYITLKLENGQTVIYVNGEWFYQCKFLLLNIPVDEIKSFDEIESIDEAVEKLDKSLEGTCDSIIIPPEVEFWGHCSNLQVWYENGYNTRLLHRNIAFPLLRKLAKANDPVAKKVFNEEVAKRLKSGYPSVVEYLVSNGYIEYEINEYITLSLESEEYEDETLYSSYKESEYYKEDYEERIYSLWYVVVHIKEKRYIKFELWLFEYFFEEPEFLERCDECIWWDDREKIYYIGEDREKYYETDVKALLNQFFKCCSKVKFWAKSNYDSKLINPILGFSILKKLTEIGEPISNRVFKKEIIKNLRNFQTYFLSFFLEEDYLSYLNKNDFESIKLNPEIPSYILDVLENLFSEYFEKLCEIAPSLFEGVFLEVLKKNDFNLTKDLIRNGFLIYLKEDELKSRLAELYSERLIPFYTVFKSKEIKFIDEKSELGLRVETIEEISNLESIGNPKKIKKLILDSRKDISNIQGLEKFTNLEELCLHGNEISEIRGLESLLNLKKLDLSRNHISEIKGLENLTKLEELNLNSNEISDICGLEKLTNLRNLNLSQNKIHEIKGLKNLVNLRKLYLGNKISEINGLERLKNLEELWLAGNITELKNLENLKNLRYLNLKENKISEIKGLENLRRLEKLLLNKNQIMEIKGIKTLKNLKHLGLCDNQIFEIKEIENLPNLEELEIKGNKVPSQIINQLGGYDCQYAKDIQNFIEYSRLKKEGSIDYVTFKSIKYNVFNNKLELRHLEIEDISEIVGLNRLIKLNELNLEGNRISEIKHLEKLINLEILNLNENQITKINGLEKLINLEVLNLNKNHISEIKGLEKLVNLKYLDLDGNKISEVKGLEYLTKLENLELRENKIPKQLLDEWGWGWRPQKLVEYCRLKKKKPFEFVLYKGNKYEIYNDKLNLNSLDINNISEIIGLDKFINLKELDLEHNQISKISCLEKLTNLKVLNLGCNNINRIESLNNLINLEKLYLCSNQIHKIEGLNNHINLEKLDLGGNQIRVINNLDKLRNLKQLDIESNQITVIDGLEKLVNLESLNLNNNQILEIKGLDNLTNLNILKIYHNKITKIQGLETPVNLEKLDLFNNRITEIKGVDNLINLRELNLGDNSISEIKGLQNLKNLQDLRLFNNHIFEIKGVDNLKNLRELDLGDNNISEIKGLQNLKILQDLRLFNNHIFKIKGLENLKNLKKLKIEKNLISRKIIDSLGGYQRYHTGTGMKAPTNGVEVPQNFVKYCQQQKNLEKKI